MRRILPTTILAGMAFGHCAAEDSALPTVHVKAEPSTAERYQWPNTVEHISQDRIQETVNIIDTPDALKYMPSLMVRKRDSADFGGATLATRIWGVSYSAKSVVMVDGMPITSQLYNDNNYGPPKWFVVSPEEIEHINVLYGPFSAAYAGNAMGAVVDITTRRPAPGFEGSISLTERIQRFQAFGTQDTYKTGQLAALLGGRSEALSWRLALNHQDANTQPRAFVTANAPVTPYPYINKTGGGGQYYLGATSLLHGVSDNVNLKLSLDLNRDTRLTLNSGVFMAQTDSTAQSYMANGFCATGTGACNTLASGVSGYRQEHWVNGVGLRSDTRGQWDYDVNLSNVRYGNDVQRTAGALMNDGTPVNGDTNRKGSVRDLSGTQWTHFDAKGIYRPSGMTGAHQWSFGYHQDFAKLQNITQNVTDWQNASQGTLNALAQGTSETRAIWLQHAYRASPQVQFVLGGRYESWSTHHGAVFASSTAAYNQPSVNREHFSPKFSTLMGINDTSTLSVSVANAMRFPTVGELYNVTTCASGCGGALAPYSPNPKLIRPEDVQSLEASWTTQTAHATYRASYFAEDVRDALISQLGNQLNPDQPNGLYTYWVNINQVRSKGLELASDIRRFIWHELDVFAAMTWVDSTITANDRNPSSVGHKTPGVSPLRVKLVGTYRPHDALSIALGASYQKQFWSTVDNNDAYPNTYLGFSGYTVMDLKARYTLDKHWVASAGIDNLGNKNYFLYHPFPQRTFVAHLKYIH
jgi:iron complex outermembrane receptor protein